MKPIWKMLCLSLLISATAGCSNLLFYPMKIHIRTPADIGLTYHDVEFYSRDNTLLHGWWLPAADTVKGTILFLHGNAENISTHIANVEWLPQHGYNVFIFDYRGYGKSEGQSELDGIIQDAYSAIDTALSHPENGHKPIIVYGQSLGGAIAVHAVAHSAKRGHIKALIVESSFSSYHQIAREKFARFWLTWPFQYPLSWSITDKYSPMDSVADISPIPLLLVHGEADRIIPPHHGQQLFAAARPPKELWLYPEAYHISAFREKAQRQRLLDYLASLP